ncbi:MAG: HNH endonuclease [Vicinamibacteria bacterium]
MPGQSRPKVSHEVQARVFFRDNWLCRWCKVPVVFASTFRLLRELAVEAGGDPSPAYFHRNWSRRSAPLLDQLGAVVDHVEAYSKGGVHGEENFVTACNKCNARKNNRAASDHTRDHPPKAIRGKYGEPVEWDGMVSVFLALAKNGATLTVTERRWASAFKGILAERAPLRPPGNIKQ